MYLIRKKNTQKSIKTGVDPGVGRSSPSLPPWLLKNRKERREKKKKKNKKMKKRKRRRKEEEKAEEEKEEELMTHILSDKKKF